jgi:hypothetical protein
MDTLVNYDYLYIRRRENLKPHLQIQIHKFHGKFLIPLKLESNLTGQEIPCFWAIRTFLPAFPNAYL